MCCIFTCCGWMIDLVQRLWTFTMSCCISSSICCVMVSTSMSGIALGYNYSLAEYIDMKETNVSVYLKRGVFDDEISDDFEFRRSGHMPVAGHIASDNLMTAAPDYSTPMESGRRLDDSLVESEDPNKYEGSLMRLTAHAPFPGTSTTMLDDAGQLNSQGISYPPGSLDELKAIHNLINARKSLNAAANDKTTKRAIISNVEDRFMAHFPNGINPGARRIIGPDGIHTNLINPARFAVPGKDIAYPRNPDKFLMKYNDPNIDIPNSDPLYPSPIPIEPAPIRPTRVSTAYYPRVPTSTQRQESTVRERISDHVIPSDKSMKAFKEKMLFDKFEAPNIEKSKEGQRSESEEYDEEIKGLPVRRRRRNVKLDSSVNTLKGNQHETINTAIILNKILCSKKESTSMSANEVLMANKHVPMAPKIDPEKYNIEERVRKVTRQKGSNVLIPKLYQATENDVKNELVETTSNKYVSHETKQTESKSPKSISNQLDVSSNLYQNSLDYHTIKVRTTMKPFRNASSYTDNINEVNSFQTLKDAISIIWNVVNRGSIASEGFYKVVDKNINSDRRDKPSDIDKDLFLGKDENPNEFRVISSISPIIKKIFLSTTIS